MVLPVVTSPVWTSHRHFVMATIVTGARAVRRIHDAARFAHRPVRAG
ncbi:MAG: hypothetical protein WDN30_13190 [Pararobbsia sp.]